GKSSLDLHSHWILGIIEPAVLLFVCNVEPSRADCSHHSIATIQRPREYRWPILSGGNRVNIDEDVLSSEVVTESVYNPVGVSSAILTSVAHEDLRTVHSIRLTSRVNPSSLLDSIIFHNH